MMSVVFVIFRLTSLESVSNIFTGQLNLSGILMKQSEV